MQVLLVEDNADSRNLLKRYLTSPDCDVATAGDLRSGIDLLARQRFDVIISDIALPDGTGYALVSEARRRGIHALCIAVSAYPFPSDVKELGATGFQHYLNKPVKREEIRSLITEGSAGVREFIRR